MQELAAQMNQTAQELHAIAEPMLQTAQGIQALAEPMLEMGRAATTAAEQARDSVERTNKLIEQSLEIAAPIQGLTERAVSLRDRLRGDRLRRTPRTRTGPPLAGERPVADPVARPGAEAGGSIPRVREFAPLE